jgi:hypothetical protein
MAPEHIFESSPGHGAIACVEEKFWNGSRATNGQPCTQVRPGPGPNWQHSFASAFPEDSNERPRFEGHVIGPQTDKLRDSKTCHKAYIQHGSVTDASASLGIRSIQYGLHLFQREMCHQLRIRFLKRYRQYLPDLL